MANDGGKQRVRAQGATKHNDSTSLRELQLLFASGRVWAHEQNVAVPGEIQSVSLTPLGEAKGPGVRDERVSIFFYIPEDGVASEGEGGCFSLTGLPERACAILNKSHRGYTRRASSTSHNLCFYSQDGGSGVAAG